MREKLMLARIFSACALFILFVGCGKKETPPTPAPSKPESASVSSLLGGQSAAPSAPGQPPPAPAAAATPQSAPTAPPNQTPAPEVEEPLTGPYALERSFMTEQLHVFVTQFKRMPKDFNEFAANRLDGAPQPPAGQKWAIDQVNRKIIAVKK
jgi:hypothetical protein